MWLSKKIVKSNSDNVAESGTVTITSSNSIEANSTVNARNLPTYAPYGYNTVTPVGEQVILVPSSDGQVAVGSRCVENALESGEVCIKSKGGATVMLKNDGSVVINSLVIDKNGVINNGSENS